MKKGSRLTKVMAIILIMSLSSAVLLRHTIAKEMKTEDLSIDTANARQPAIEKFINAVECEEIDSGKVYRIQSAYGKYLDADTSEAISQSILDTDDGGQLWYLTDLKNGYYKISSLGHREPTTLGAKDYVLSVNNSGTIGLTKDTDEPNQHWLIQIVGNSSYIANRTNPTAILTVDSDVCDPYLERAGLPSEWAFEPVTADTYIPETADCIYSNGTTDPIRINYLIEDSAITPWMPYTMYQEAGNSWNDINSNVVIGVYHATDSDIPLGFNVYVRGNPDLVDCYGSTYRTTNGAYIKAVWIEINTCDGVLNAPRLTDIDRKMNIIHEMGHSLQLDDINEREPSLRVVTVMSQGLPTDNPEIAAMPSGYDKAVLRNRW